MFRKRAPEANVTASREPRVDHWRCIRCVATGGSDRVPCRTESGAGCVGSARGAPHRFNKACLALVLASLGERFPNLISLRHYSHKAIFQMTDRRELKSHVRAGCRRRGLVQRRTARRLLSVLGAVENRSIALKIKLAVRSPCLSSIEGLLPRESLFREKKILERDLSLAMSAISDQGASATAQLAY